MCIFAKRELWFYTTTVKLISGRKWWEKLMELTARNPQLVEVILGLRLQNFMEPLLFKANLWQPTPIFEHISVALTQKLQITQSHRASYLKSHIYCSLILEVSVYPEPWPLNQGVGNHEWYLNRALEPWKKRAKSASFWQILVKSCGGALGITTCGASTIKVQKQS